MVNLTSFVMKDGEGKTQVDINTDEVELYDPSGSDIYGTGQYSLSKEYAIELAKKILNTYDVKL